ncbi:MAG: MATE family efflux transporter [Nonlabens sp.]|uniref:MATE family efflux transporter n=2 Tax=Nonlabens sp. TaxID=1888209 RepID=UPI00321BB884
MKTQMALRDYTREFKKNTQIALPIILGQLAHLLVALADNIMVGQLGKEQLAAVSLGNTLIFIAMSVGIGFSFAITPLVAEADAQKDTNKVTSIFHNGLFLCAISGVLLAIVLFIAEPILYYLDQPEEVVVLAIPYMRWVSISLIPLMLFQAVKQFSDGLSKTVYPMMASILANVINIGVNYIFIYGKLGMPRLEVEGAAIGTLVARVLMFVLLWVVLSRKALLKQHFVNFKSYSSKTVSKLMSIGFPTSLQMFFEVSLFTAAIFLSGVISTESQAANQIALNLSALTFMFGVGLGVTATIRLGNQLGLKDIPALKRIARSTFLMSLIVGVFFALLFISLNNFLPTIYIEDPGVLELAAGLLIIAGIFQISDATQVTLLGALRGLQDVWIPSLICFTAYWIVGLPISYYLGIESDYGVNGVWIGLLFGLTTSSILMYARYRYLLVKLFEKH